MKRLVIGLDLDGVIIDSATVMLPLLSEVCNRPVSIHEIYCPDFGVALNIDEESVHYVWQQTLEKGLIMNASPIAGAIDGLSAISRHEIWLVTARPGFIQSLTESWLNEREIRYDNILFDMGGNKHSARPGFDVFIEDFVEEARIIANAGIYTLLFNQPWNQTTSLPENCRRVHSWNDIVLAVNKLASEIEEVT